MSFSTYFSEYSSADEKERWALIDPYNPHSSLDKIYLETNSESQTPEMWYEQLQINPIFEGVRHCYRDKLFHETLFKFSSLYSEETLQKWKPSFHILGDDKYSERISQIVESFIKSPNKEKLVIYQNDELTEQAPLHVGAVILKKNQDQNDYLSAYLLESGTKYNINYTIIADLNEYANSNGCLIDLIMNRFPQQSDSESCSKFTAVNIQFALNIPHLIEEINQYGQLELAQEYEFLRLFDAVYPPIFYTVSQSRTRIKEALSNLKENSSFWGKRLKQIDDLHYENSINQKVHEISSTYLHMIKSCMLSESDHGDDQQASFIE